MTKKLALGLIATAALAASACTVDVHGEDTILKEQRRIPVTGTPNLTIRSFDGSIELRGWDRDEIRLDLERRAGTEADARDIRVDVTQSDGEILVEARPGRRNGLFEHFASQSPRVRMVFAVPHRLDVVARTGDGVILARDLNGRIELSTGDGSVRLQNLQGRMTIRTGDGAVTANELQGSVTVSTAARHKAGRKIEATFGIGSVPRLMRARHLAWKDARPPRRGCRINTAA